MPAYKRILLKLSGEALMGDDAYGINRDTLWRIVNEVKTVADLGVEIGIVIGGGNIFRGMAGASTGMDRATADYMGMLATVMNAMALADAMRQANLQARVQSAVAEIASKNPYSPWTLSSRTQGRKREGFCCCSKRMLSLYC